MSFDKIILGTVQFGLDYGINNSSGKPSFESITAILNTSHQNGIVMLDTAEAYGNAHEVIGNYHRQSENRFQIITKFSSKRDDLPTNIEDRIALHLDEMHVSSLYAYMFHSFGDFENYFSNHSEGLDNLKKKGIIRKIGVSVYTNEELNKLLNYPEVELVQLPFNLLDNNHQRGLLLKRARERNIEIHTRSAFLQGLFFIAPNELPGKLLPLKPYLETIRFEVSKRNITINDLALNYNLQQALIDKVLIGVDNVEQLQQNLTSMSEEIDTDLMALIDSIEVKELNLLNPVNWN